MKYFPLIGLWLILNLAGGNALAQLQTIQIEKVEVQFLHASPVVLLVAEEKAIPIFVDATVAGSILGALTGEKFPRPLPHDLMQDILKTYEINLERVFISLQKGVFYGTLTFSHNGRKQEFDSRSSDAIALAVHFRSPIFVSRDLMDSAGKKMNGESERHNEVEL